MSAGAVHKTRVSSHARKSQTQWALRNAEQRALLAAGCDLYDLLTHAPQGRQALQDLLAQPVSHDAKSIGGGWSDDGFLCLAP